MASNMTHSDTLRLLSKGTNSHIFTYGTGASQSVLKAVPVSCSKEANHLKNEYQILKKLSDYSGVVKVTMFK